MQLDLVEVLPYRTDPEQLARWIEARARGRSSAQLRELDLAPKTLEGTLATASALGLLDRDTQELTPVGQRYALASDAERRLLLRSALHGFAPFARLLDAVAARPQRSVTDATWIETWWATHGFGSSQSNRVEATAVFGRFVEYVGWGRYIPGRRGHPTRIEWTEEVFTGGAEPTPRQEPEVARPATRAAGPPSGSIAPVPPSASAPTLVAASAVADGTLPSGVDSVPAAAPAPAPAQVPLETHGHYNRIVVPLRSGEVARLEVPQRLPREEKRRLVELLDLLITVEETRDQ